MLGSFKKLFAGRPQSEEVESEYHESTAIENPNFITNPDKITKLLQDIEEASPLCTINIDGKTEEFSSSILEVNLEKKQLIIDELHPENGNHYLTKDHKLKLTTIHNGIRLAFQLTNIKPGSSQGIAYYKVNIPSRIYYPQRRSSPRIQINLLNIPFSGTSNNTHASISGYIFDLSRGGVGIISQNNRARVKRGDIIQNCQIQLDESRIKFDLTARFIKPVSSGTEKTQIGGYFINLPPKDQKKLEYFVASLEREEIRKRKDN